MTIHVEVGGNDVGSLADLPDDDGPDDDGQYKESHLEDGTLGRTVYLNLQLFFLFHYDSGNLRTVSTVRTVDASPTVSIKKINTEIFKMPNPNSSANMPRMIICNASMSSNTFFLFIFVFVLILIFILAFLPFNLSFYFGYFFLW